MFKVFVYGTLKRGKHSRSYVLNFYDFISAKINDVGLYDSIYPCAMDLTGAVIYGEVYDVNRDTLMQLDMIEGHPDFYIRKRKKAIDKDNNEYFVWIYLNRNLCKAGIYNESGVF